MLQGFNRTNYSKSCCKELFLIFSYALSSSTEFKDKTKIYNNYIEEVARLVKHYNSCKLSYPSCISGEVAQLVEH